MKAFLFCLLLWGASLQGKVYDCFLFFNEIEILKIRLAELNEVVDHFVLVESLETFQGNPKPLFFEENKEEFAPYLDKIIHIVVERHPEFLDHWDREAYQRSCTERGVVDADDSDTVMLSDCDEIPRAEVVVDMKNADWHPKAQFYFLMDVYMIHLNRVLPRKRWVGSIATTANNYRQMGRALWQHKRERRKNSPNVTLYRHAGWHFTSIGDCENLIYKTGSYSHLKTPKQTKEIYAARTKDSHDLVAIDETFPRYVQENKDYLTSIGYIFPIDK